MKNIEKKALAHASAILGSIDAYPTYRALNQALQNLAVDAKIMQTILNAFSEIIAKEKVKVMEAQQWIESVLKDTE